MRTGSAVSVVALAAFAAHAAVAQPRATPPAPVTALKQGVLLERALGAGETQAFTVSLKAGEFFQGVAVQKGVDVIVRVFAPDGSKVVEIDSPNGDQGDEPIAFDAKTTGKYRIEIVFNPDQGNHPGKYEIKVNQIMSAEERAAQSAEDRRRNAAVLAWLKSNAIPIKTVVAGNSFDDLQPLKTVFQNVRYVGLGEATHGSREFFQFKHRMVEFLVREMGFRVFAIEGSYAALQNINDYVQGKTSDGAAALDSQGFWTWNTEEVRSLLDWARAYNLSVAPDQRVEFAGIDIQVNQLGRDKLLAYLKRVAPERVATTTTLFAQDLDVLIEQANTPEQSKAATDKLVALQGQYNDLLVFLELNGVRLSALSTPVEHEQMREYARVLAQYIASYALPRRQGSLARDQFMADNFRRLVAREAAGTRIIVWAHDYHIATSGSDGTTPTLGGYLHRFYGDQYYALGFGFKQGQFQAREQVPRDPDKQMLVAWTAPPAAPDSIEGTLAQTGLPRLLVDFRSSPKNKDISAWLQTPHPFRTVGSTYTPTRAGAYYSPTTLQGLYDGLFYIDTTTRARPNPSVPDVATSP